MMSHSRDKTIVLRVPPCLFSRSVWGTEWRPLVRCIQNKRKQKYKYNLFLRSSWAGVSRFVPHPGSCIEVCEPYIGVGVELCAYGERERGGGCEQCNIWRERDLGPTIGATSGLFAAGRLIAVPIASRLTASFMLAVNIVGCAVALLLTIIFRWSHVMIYIGTCSVGLFVSSMSPTVMSMAEQFIDINPSITTCLVVVAALGEALCPVIVGNLVVSKGPSSFLVFCFTFSVSAIFLYIALLFVGRQSDKFKAYKSQSFIWLSGKQLIVEGESTFIKPSSIKYYSRMSESDSNMELGPMGSQENLTEKH
ncbi:Major facilitator super domain-containing protein 4A [Bulinus truncatus]|nr:Major facilitator super domain-containing protein 4A [Bulinus truncatus]